MSYCEDCMTQDCGDCSNNKNTAKNHIQDLYSHLMPPNFNSCNLGDIPEFKALPKNPKK